MLHFGTNLYKFTLKKYLKKCGMINCMNLKKCEDMVDIEGCGISCKEARSKPKDCKCVCKGLNHGINYSLGSSRKRWF
jgi:hypothetical protein